MASLSILEIGVQNGGSLEVWAQYFPNARVIVGCDIDENCRILKYEDARVKVVIADATSKLAEAKVLGYAPSFDLIIDDGSHYSDHIIQSFLIFFPHLSPGGIYVVEDAHTLFWKQFGGGLFRKGSAQEFFKLFADMINHEHWRVDANFEDMFQDFPFFLDDQLFKFFRDGWVEAVEFSNSMIIVRKSASAGGARLGRRLVAGEYALVNSKPLSYSARS